MAGQRVTFGTSGHRGSAFKRSFNEAHVLAITQAICEYRAGQGIRGPLFLGFDSHALSAPAYRTALEVLAANEVLTMVDSRGDFTPTPAVSHAILTHNLGPGRATLRRGRGGRDPDHPVAQSAPGRRLQVQPPPRGPGGHGRHALDRVPGERLAGGEAAGGAPLGV